jgi:uncharacterized membrane protein
LTEDQETRDVRALVRVAVSRLAPRELSPFDDVWQTYLDNPRPSKHILQSGDAALGSGMELIGTAVTPLLAAVTGEALADLVKEPAAGAVRAMTRHLPFVGGGRAARRAALTRPAPDPAAIEHAVMRALFLDIALRAGTTDEHATAIADTLHLYSRNALAWAPRQARRKAP